jgi:hypothetical protein
VQRGIFVAFKKREEAKIPLQNAPAEFCYFHTPFFIDVAYFGAAI